jgi:two-component system OmpR family sensor kinase
MTWRRALALALAPALPFLAIALAAAVGAIPDDSYYLEGDVVALAVILALLVAVLGSFLTWRAAVHRRRTRLAAAEARAAAQAVAAADRGHLLYRLDHEIKTPITTARSEVANLRVTVLTLAQRRMVATIESQLQRVGDLTAGLRGLMDLRTRALEREPVDMATLAKEIASFVEQQGAGLPFFAAGGKIDFRCKVPWELPTLSLDVALMSIALQNVIGNAVKFTPPGGRIDVEVDQAGAWVTVEVIDTGRGIPTADVERVGQELHRAPNAADLPGQGLGLAMARAIVERHEGRLEVQSTVDRGTKMTVWLPVGDT